MTQTPLTIQQEIAQNLPAFSDTETIIVNDWLAQPRLTLVNLINSIVRNLKLLVNPPPNSSFIDCVKLFGFLPHTGNIRGSTIYNNPLVSILIQYFILTVLIPKDDCSEEEKDNKRDNICNNLSNQWDIFCNYLNVEHLQTQQPFHQPDIFNSCEAIDGCPGA